MTKLLEQAFETVRGLPAKMQDDLARVLLLFASDERVRAIWAKHGL